MTVNEELDRMAAEICQAIGLPEFIMGLRPILFLADPRTGDPIPYVRAVGTDYIRRARNITVSVLRRDGRVFDYNPELGIVTVEVVAEMEEEGRKQFVEEIGAVHVYKLDKDPERAKHNAIAVMKALTKARRRAILRLAGIGLPDESEIENSSSVPSAAEGGLVVPEAALAEFQE